MTRPTLSRLTMARALVFAFLAATAWGLPTAALAADIAWQQVTKKKAETQDKVARAGTATLSDGQQASVAAELTFGPKDLKDRQTFKGRTVLSFKDKSTITIDYSGSANVTDYTNRGTGKIVSGTGRFAGISGTVTFDGRFSDSQWKGSYALPGK
jgi:hypothetical protein